MKKIISLITLIAFLASNASFASECLLERSSADGMHLAPPLVLSDMGDDTPHHKNITLAEIALQMDLKKLDGTKDIDGATDIRVISDAFAKARLIDKAYHEESIFGPARITVYFNGVTHVAGHIFMVPVSVGKDDTRYDYRILFSTIRNKDNAFPTVIATEEAIKELKEKIVRRDTLPTRTDSDEKAISRYKSQNEYVIDKFIQDRIKADDSAEIEGNPQAFTGTELEGKDKEDVVRDYLAALPSAKKAGVSTNPADYKIIRISNGYYRIVDEKGIASDFYRRGDKWHVRVYGGGILRDDGAASEDESGGSERLPTWQELAQEINDVWRTPGWHTGRPFTPHAQDVFNRIIGLYRLSKRYQLKFPPDTCYKICAALLYGAFNHEAVIGFFENLIRGRKEFGPFLNAVLHDEDFALLYFVARMMDEKSVKKAVDNGKNVFAYYENDLFGPDIITLDLFQDDAKAIGFIERIRRKLYLFIEEYRSRGQCEEAMRLIDNLLADYNCVREGVRGFGYGDIFEKDINRLLKLRGEIKKEAVLAEIHRQLAGRGCSRQEQFDTVLAILRSKYPPLAKSLEDLQHLVEEESPDMILGAINALPLLEQDKEILLCAFLRSGEGGGEYLPARERGPVNGREASSDTLLNAYGLIAASALEQLLKKDSDASRLAGVVFDAFINGHEKRLSGESLDSGEITQYRDRLAEILGRTNPNAVDAAREALTRIGLWQTDEVLMNWLCRMMKGKAALSDELFSSPRFSGRSLIRAYNFFGHVQLNETLEKGFPNAWTLVTLVFDAFIERQTFIGSGDRIIKVRRYNHEEIERYRANMRNALMHSNVIDVNMAIDVLRDLGLLNEGQRDPMVDWLCRIMAAARDGQDINEIKPDRIMIATHDGQDADGRALNDDQGVSKPKPGKVEHNLPGSVELEGNRKLIALGYFAVATGEVIGTVTYRAENYRVFEIEKGVRYHIVELPTHIGTDIVNKDGKWQSAVDGGGILRDDGTASMPAPFTPKPGAGRQVRQISAELPEEYINNGMDYDSLTMALREAGWTQLARLDEKTALIFSEKVTFEHRIGRLLPKLVKSGIKVAVVAPNEGEQELIRKISKGTIICGEDIATIKNLMSRMNVTRYRYLKVEGDPVVEGDPSVETFDITRIVRQIIDALGKACGMPVDLLPRLHEAVQRFDEAA